MLWRFLMIALALALMDHVQGKVDSFGTLMECDSTSQRCLWMGLDSQLVSSEKLTDQALDSYGKKLDYDIARRNLARRMNYLQEMMLYAQKTGHVMGYKVGIHARHLHEEEIPELLPEMHVENNRRALKDQKRGMSSGTHRDLQSSLPSSLNWCSEDNPQKRSVCAPVKSQQQCGSCWAFAAADAIETAVSISSNRSAVALSPQQFLACSKNEMSQTFNYCWASGGVSGAPWMESSIKWSSKNNGCEGGMTHGAFQYAAQERQVNGIVSELDMPYVDGAGVASRQCDLTGLTSAASIKGWEQIVGESCAESSDVNLLLKTALQKQPITVAINSKGTFKDYKGGYYTCPNNGDLADNSQVDHALVLVGYGTTSESGNYWILKNSYGGGWGDEGFMKIQEDSKLNCGISVYPVIPTGAAAGASNNTVDGGGESDFLDMSFDTWQAVGIAVSVGTVVSIIAGLVVSNMERRKITMST